MKTLAVSALFIFSSVLLSTFLSVSAYVLPSSDAGAVGNPCRLSTGSKGVCTLITNCPPALEAVRQGTRRGQHGTIARCGFQGTIEIVCCDAKMGNRGGSRGGNRGGTRNGKPHTDTEWLNKPRGSDKTMQTLTERKTSNACRFYNSKCPKSVKPYILDGEVADLGEFPHMVALGYPTQNPKVYTWDCGGSLISERYVLTAAHCTNLLNRKPVVARLGELDLSTNEDGATPVDYPIEKIDIHPSFKSDLRYHDIALLRLKSPVKFTEFICPACLYTGKKNEASTRGGETNELTDRILNEGEEIGPRINDEVELRGKTLIVSGWGTTEYLGDASAVLLKAKINPYSIEECNKTLSLATGRSLPMIPRGLLPAAQLCAGDRNGNKDTCQGDSGGPLQYFTKNSPLYTVVGITSFGEKCGFQVPAVYTRVESYLEWIEGLVWPGAPPSG